MAVPSFVSRLLKMLTPSHTLGHAQSGTPPPFTDWPLQRPVMVLLMAARAELPLQYRGTARGIQVFAYPFDMPEIAGLVPIVPSPESGGAVDGKYCEFVSADGSVRYFACRALIDALSRAAVAHGKGMSRLRWVAFDQFGYPDEAARSCRDFEDEMGETMVATGLARVLLSRRPARALEILQDAARRGISGAAFSACQAQALLACGQVSEGVKAAAQALRRLPDPLWMPADHASSWGILHGAALACWFDDPQREDVSAAIRTLAEPPASARRVLACAGLFEAAQDAVASAHHAEAALRLAGDDEPLRKDAEAMLQRARGVIAGTTHPPVDTGTAQDPMIHAAARSVFVSPDAEENVVVSAGPRFDGPDLSDIWAVRDYCRKIAERRGAGLVEACVVQTSGAPAIQLIYKQRDGAGYVFTGVQLVAEPEATRTWTVEAREGRTTGIRESVVTAHLTQQGQLTIEAYKTTWCRDPYDPAYRGVDRSLLRFISDDPVYDRMLRGHPLSRVRRTLRNLAPPPASEPRT